MAPSCIQPPAPGIKKPDFAAKSGFFMPFSTFYCHSLKIIAIAGKVSESGAVIPVRRPLQ